MFLFSAAKLQPWKIPCHIQKYMIVPGGVGEGKIYTFVYGMSFGVFLILRCSK